MRARARQTEPASEASRPFFSRPRSPSFFPGPRAQPKLKTGPTDDALEREADQVAEQVTSEPAVDLQPPPSSLPPPPDGGSEAPAIQRKEADSEPGTQAGPVTDPDVLAGSPELRPENEPELETVDYAFFYTGGGYGNSARRFFEVFYPQHIRVQAASFEEMFDRMHQDLLRHERAKRRVQVGEIVIVTHANAAGGLQIPLARDDVKRKRNFTPWDLAGLQQEFQDRTHEAFKRRQRFRERRQAVVSRFLGPSTKVVVRGCGFGRSQEGLDALRSFFGGNLYVWAPKGFQGYQVAGIGKSHLDSAEEAFDVLQAQGQIPQDLELSADEKRLYLQKELGIRGAVPSEFFVMGEDDYAALKGLIGKGKGLSEEAETHVTREGVDVPSLGEFWGLSSPSALGRDPELDRLSLEEIERRSRILHDNYQPSYAPMLIRLREAWERHPERQRRFMEATLNPEKHPEARDPLFGLPPSELFGDPNILAMDAVHYRPLPAGDTFEEEALPFAPPAEGTAAASVFEEGPAAIDEAALAAEKAAQATAGGGVTAAAAGPGGAVPRQPTAGELAAARDFSKDVKPPVPELPLDQMSEYELGQEYLRALALSEQGDWRRLAEVENEIGRRIDDPEHPGFGVALPRNLPPGQPANTGVEPDIGLRILENVAKGEPPFRPELGRVGGASWFVTEGNPYVGRDVASRITIEVEIIETEGRIVFREPELLEIFERERTALEPTIEADFRRRLGLDPSTPLTRRMRRNLVRLLEQAAEGRMWERIGETVRASPSGVGEVVLENSRFSRAGNGRFGVVADARKIRLRGGVARLLETLEARGLRPDPTVTAAAEHLASKQKWAGRVRGAFHYGGRILIVVGVANDVYRVIVARDRTKAVISSAGGWAGAVAAGALFAKVWTPADTAGPVAWVIHGVGTLVAGGVGYFVGSETTTYVYELAVEDESEAQGE